MLSRDIARWSYVKSLIKKIHFYVYLLVTELYRNIQIELEEEARAKWSPVFHLTAWWPGFEWQVFS